MTWLSHEEATAHVGLKDPRCLRRMVDETPGHIRPAWVNVSGTRRPRYRWRSVEEIDRWLGELEAWRRESGTAARLSSDGETPTGERGSGASASDAAGRRAKSRGSRRRTSAKSARPKRSADAGNLAALAARLTSERR